MTVQNQITPKSYILNDLTIYPQSHAPITLQFRMIEMNIYEDLFTNSIYADILISDSNNIIQNYPIYGFEQVSINFSTPGAQPFQKTMRVYKISKQQPVKEREQAFILHLVSAEEIQNYQTRVSKAYVGKPISDIVQDIQSNYLKSSFTFLEPTKYLQHIIVPNLLPFDAIRWLSTRAISSNTNAPSYLYFQNKNGYQFTTIDNLVQQTPAVTYNYQPTNLANFDPSFQTIQSFSYDTMFDLLDKVKNGMYGSNLKTYDTVSKVYKSNDFIYSQDYYNSRSHLHPNTSKNPLTGTTGSTYLQNQNAELANPTGVQRFFSIRAGQQYESKMDEVLLERISRLEQHHWLNLNFTIPGDSNRVVGDVVTFNHPSTEPLDKKNQIPNYYFSGNYIISSLRHLIKQEEYITVLTLTRESSPVPFP